MESTFLSTLTEAMLPLVGLVITFAVAYATSQINALMKPGAAKDALLEVVAGAEIVVRNLEQTVKPALLAAAKDGKLTGSEGQDLKKQALAALKTTVSAQSQKLITANGARLEDILGRAIEAQVNKGKETKPVVPPSTETKP